MKLNPETLLKAMSDATRLRSVLLLLAEDELCVCELTHALGLEQPKISRHLALLREMQLVVDHRKGKWVYYSINSKIPSWAKKFLQSLQKGCSEEKLYQSDLNRLHNMPNRPENRICV